MQVCCNHICISGLLRYNKLEFLVRVIFTTPKHIQAIKSTKPYTITCLIQNPFSSTQHFNFLEMIHLILKMKIPGNQHIIFPTFLDSLYLLTLSARLNFDCFRMIRQAQKISGPLMYILTELGFATRCVHNTMV